MTVEKYLPRPNRRITALANGVLYRAIVTLPNFMIEPEQPFEERIVFYEASGKEDYGRHLEALLAKAWCIDTINWCDQGFIANIYSAEELLSEGCNAGRENDLALFEIGWGGKGIDAVGPDAIHYARKGRVDLFVTPRVARRLHDALDAIDLLYQLDARGRDKP